jgi:hypothetical protein
MWLLYLWLMSDIFSLNIYLFKEIRLGCFFVFFWEWKHVKVCQKNSPMRQKYRIMWKID